VEAAFEFSEKSLEESIQLYIYAGGNREVLIKSQEWRDGEEKWC